MVDKHNCSTVVDVRRDARRGNHGDGVETTLGRPGGRSTRRLDSVGTTQPHRIVRHAPTRVAAHREQILAAIEHGLSNGLVESLNTKIRLLTRIAFGFARPKALVSLVSTVS